MDQLLRHKLPKFTQAADKLNNPTSIKGTEFLVNHCKTIFFLQWRKANSQSSHWWIFSSVQFSRSVMSDSLQPHESQHTRPPYPSPTARVYPNPCPLSRWCHPTILSSVVPFSSCLQCFQYPSLFKWVSSSHQVAKVLEFQLQHQSFQWTPRTDLF